MYPQRIICLGAEAADICAAVGAWDRVVGVSAFVDQGGREPKRVVSGFSSGDAARIARLDPDMVITFSDVQAELTANLVRLGCTVLATNQRSLAEVGDAIRLIARAVGCEANGEQVAGDFVHAIERCRIQPEQRPRVYFEEWPDPLIAGIEWVSELISLTGGTDIFSDRRGKGASERIIQPHEVLAALPDIIVASWCGKPVDSESIRSREGWHALPAVRDDEIHEIPSSRILQAGPGLVAGAESLGAIFARWANRDLPRSPA